MNNTDTILESDNILWVLGPIEIVPVVCSVFTEEDNNLFIIKEKNPFVNTTPEGFFEIPI